jgi:hypothetical protein
VLSAFFELNVSAKRLISLVSWLSSIELSGESSMANRASAAAVAASVSSPDAEAYIGGFRWSGVQQAQAGL